MSVSIRKKHKYASFFVGILKRILYLFIGGDDCEKISMLFTGRKK